MARLRLGLLNLKEDGNGISTGDRLHGVMDANLRILCSSSFPFQAEKMFFFWETAKFCFSEHFPFKDNTLLDKQSWKSPKLGKNMHLGPLLILQGLNPICSHSGDSQEQILFQTDFNKTDFFSITSLAFQKTPLTLHK